MSGRRSYSPERNGDMISGEFQLYNSVRGQVEVSGSGASRRRQGVFDERPLFLEQNAFVDHVTSLGYLSQTV